MWQNRFRKLPWITGLLITAVGSLFWLAPRGSVYFDRLLLTKADIPELLRYITGQFLHIEPQHLLWNLLALAISGMLIEARSRMLLLLSLFAGILAVAIWFTLETRFDYYAGISGALNALFVTAIYCLFDDRKLLSTHNLAIAIIFLIYLGKNAFELATGTAAFNNLEWSITPGAHISGMVAGVICIGIYRATKG